MEYSENALGQIQKMQNNSNIRKFKQISNRKT